MNNKSLLIRSLLSAVAVSAFAYTVGYRHKQLLSRDELILLGVAVLPWLSEFVTSFKIGATGVEVITQRLDNVEKKAKAAFDASVHGVAKHPHADRGKTKNGSAPNQLSPTVSDDDPNKSKFGGNATANSRRLSARVEKIPDEEFYRRVVLQVRSTDKHKPLTGNVTFHLHPTFDRPVFDEPVANGIAETTLVSYGAFTVGVEADGGATKLELDLTSLDNGDPFFDR